MKYKAGDKVRIKSIDWYNENKDELGDIECGDALMTFKTSHFCGKIVTISSIGDVTDTYRIEEDNRIYLWTDEMIEGLAEEETPKFKVNDIVFVKNIGWVRITNSYWDSLANEYIYEAIGFNGEGEYDCINQSDIECQKLPESENPHTGGNKITLDEYKNNDKEWLFNKLAMLDNITALESIQDIFNHLQQSKYPKTYEECCKILGIDPDNFLSIRNIHCYDGEEETVKYERDLLEKFDSLWVLLICRDAYWKIAGEEMGLDKPWEPDFEDDIYYIYYDTHKRIFSKDYCAYGINVNHFLVFPTEEMRDAFYENFKKEIEMCKELL